MFEADPILALPLVMVKYLTYSNSTVPKLGTARSRMVLAARGDRFWVIEIYLVLH
jgi:hypothetical protein